MENSHVNFKENQKEGSIATCTEDKNDYLLTKFVSEEILNTEWPDSVGFPDNNESDITSEGGDDEQIKSFKTLEDSEKVNGIYMRSRLQ